MEDGWDVKKTMKRIVMSATYQQTSHVPAELYQRDPENRLLARGPRFRLDAEMLRDQALAVSGLLVDKMGGPSVKPPQPDGLWFAVGYSGSNTVRFQADTGPRRCIVGRSTRSSNGPSPPPQLSTFDAPSREACCVRRERTNTPLQALLLMNDPQYVECARALGERTHARRWQLSRGSKPPGCFSRLPVGRQMTRNWRNWWAPISDHLAHYREHRSRAAKSLIQIGESEPDRAAGRSPSWRPGRWWATWS